MDKKATKSQMDSRHINLKAWCRAHNVNYTSAYGLLTKPTKILETRQQREVIEALKADGLYVEAKAA